MKRFDYLAPHTLSEALEMLRQRPEAKPLAGGTDILVQMKEQHRGVTALLSLKRIPELHRLDQNGMLTIGSAVTMRKLSNDPVVREKYAALALSAGLIGSVQIRTVATLGGNLCNASPSADTAPPLLALGAEAVIAGPGGERVLPLEEFFLGPGKTALQAGELLSAVRLPKWPEWSGSFYLRHTPRAWMDLAFAGAAAAVTIGDTGELVHVRIALGAVSPTPVRALNAEEILTGEIPDDRLLAKAGEAAAAEARPIDDLRASAEYRRHLVNVLTQRALRQAIIRAKGNHEP